MRNSTIAYKILYHGEGYIRLEVPSLKNLPWPFFHKNLTKSLPFPTPSGIKNLHLNPFQGDIVIIYEPNAIYIVDYIEYVASDSDVKKLLLDECHEMSLSH